MKTTMLYPEDFIQKPSNITTSWAPTAGDVTALEDGPARFYRTDEASFSISFDAVALGASAVVIILEQVDLGTDGAIATAQRGANVPAAFPEDESGNLRLLYGRNTIALLGLSTAASDSAELNLTFSGGDVAFDIHHINTLQQWDWPTGVDADWSVSYVDQSSVRVSDSGISRVTRRHILRELSFRIRNRDEDSLILPVEHGLMRIMRRVGRSRPIMVIPRTGTQPVDAEAAVYGYLQRDPEVSHVAGAYFSSDELRVREFA